MNNGTRLLCVCPAGYEGAHCELITDYCRSQPVSTMMFNSVSCNYFTINFSAKMEAYAQIQN